MIDRATLDSFAIDRIDADDLLYVLTLDLADHCYDAADASLVVDWRDAAGQTWHLPCHALVIGSRVVMWTRTDEAGIDDVTVVDRDGEVEDQLREFAEDIADDLGTLIGDATDYPTTVDR